MNQLLTEMDGFESNKGVVPGIKKEPVGKKSPEDVFDGFVLFLCSFSQQ